MEAGNGKGKERKEKKKEPLDMRGCHDMPRHGCRAGHCVPTLRCDGVKLPV